MRAILSRGFLAVLLGTIAIGYGCAPNQTKIEYSTEQEEQERSVIDITVSVEPQKYFVKKIGGDRVNVNVLVTAGVDPHSYEPKPQQLKDIANAEAYIIIGGDSFEKAWMPRIKSANQNLEIIDSGEGITRIEKPEGHHHHHHHHHGEKHEHGGADPHIWLSPTLAKIQAENIYQGLVKLDPVNKNQYRENLASFIAEIDAIDSRIKRNLAGIENRKFIVFHPAWSYFAREYDLVQIPIEVEGTEPSAAELKELIETARKENIKVIFVEPQFSQKSALTIAREIGARVIPINPLAENWGENLLKISEIFAEELRQVKTTKGSILADNNTENDLLQ